MRACVCLILVTQSTSTLVCFGITPEATYGQTEHLECKQRIQSEQGGTIRGTG